MSENMNSGYSGYSMSRRAVSAYEDGEKPASKWTKAAMVGAINDYLDNEDLACDLDLRSMRKAELFERFFCKSSWHHTSKFCNETDFYALDEDALCEAARDATEDELATRRARERARQDAEDARRRAQHDAAHRLVELHQSVAERTGYAWGTPGAYAALFPERLLASHTSKRGNLVLTVTAPDGMEVSGIADTPSWRLDTTQAVAEAEAALMPAGVVEGM